jgi:hypothetical protein
MQGNGGRASLFPDDLHQHQGAPLTVKALL